MRSWKPSRGELLFLSAAALIWLAILCWLPPNMGGTDDYMFRDPACNFAAGLGFRSASVDHAHSFQPMLYSHYTPLSLWLFIPVAKFFGCKTLIGQSFITETLKFPVSSQDKNSILAFSVCFRHL